MSGDHEPVIVIAGMGPVGMTAALILARQGLPVTLLEAGADLAVNSRASTFHPSSLEILDELGIVDELLAVGLKAPGFQYRGRNRELIAHLDMSALSGDTKFPFRVQSEQSNLTRIIRAHLERMPNVTLRFSAPVERVEEGRDHAYVYLPGDGFEASYRADWLIAADGSNSAVRRSMGIAFEGVTYPERFLVASTTHEFRDDFEDLAYVSYVYDPEDWGVLLRTPNHWRVLFPIREGETNERACDPARIEERLQSVVARDSPYPVVHSTIYAVHQRLAATFGRGRVLLAGDAAHINNPLGGMGMNSGLHDAEAATQAVRYALDGGSPARAVETYARVRRDAAAHDVQQTTQKNYDEMRERDGHTRMARMKEMEVIAADPVRMRTYLRGAALLASREVSNRRMRRGLTPPRPHLSRSAGSRLSDAIGEKPTSAGPLGALADTAIGCVCERGPRSSVERRDPPARRRDGPSRDREPRRRCHRSGRRRQSHGRLRAGGHRGDRDLGWRHRRAGRRRCGRRRGRRQPDGPAGARLDGAVRGRRRRGDDRSRSPLCRGGSRPARPRGHRRHSSRSTPSIAPSPKCRSCS